jgi:hypothetical protein
LKNGHIYVVYTVLAKTPKEKIALCFCCDEGLCFWINTKPNQNGHGQYPLKPSDHESCLTHDCFLDASRPILHSAAEMASAKDRGQISPELARYLHKCLSEAPPKTLPSRYFTQAIASLSKLF